MPISFCTIYNQNSVIKNDPVLDSLPTPLFYEAMWRYLQYSISYFYKSDTVDPGQTVPRVGQYTPFTKIAYEFIGNGVDTEFALTSPSIANGEYFVEVIDDTKRTAITEFSYSESTNTMTLLAAPDNGVQVVITNYFIGEFVGEVPLNEAEIMILAEGMNVPFVEGEEMRRDLLEMKVYSSTFKSHSRAEHLQRVSGTVKQQRDYVNTLIIDYSYKYNDNRYMGLVGMM